MFYPLILLQQVPIHAMRLGPVLPKPESGSFHNPASLPGTLVSGVSSIGWKVGWEDASSCWPALCGKPPIPDRNVCFISRHKFGISTPKRGGVPGCLRSLAALFPWVSAEPAPLPMWSGLALELRKAGEEARLTPAWMAHGAQVVFQGDMNWKFSPQLVSHSQTLQLHRNVTTHFPLNSKWGECG